MRIVLDMTPEQYDQIRALYTRAGQCSLCGADMVDDEDKLLYAQPQSHKGGDPGRMRVDSVCTKCHWIMAASMNVVRGTKLTRKPDVQTPV